MTSCSQPSGQDAFEASTKPKGVKIIDALLHFAKYDVLRGREISFDQLSKRYDEKTDETGQITVLDRVIHQIFAPAGKILLAGKIEQLSMDVFRLTEASKKAGFNGQGELDRKIAELKPLDAAAEQKYAEARKYAEGLVSNLRDLFDAEDLNQARLVLNSALQGTGYKCSDKLTIPEHLIAKVAA